MNTVFKISPLSIAWMYRWATYSRFKPFVLGSRSFTCLVASTSTEVALHGGRHANSKGNSRMFHWERRLWLMCKACRNDRRADKKYRWVFDSIVIFKLFFPKLYERAVKKWMMRQPYKRYLRDERFLRPGVAAAAISATHWMPSFVACLTEVSVLTPVIVMRGCPSSNNKSIKRPF